MSAFKLISSSLSCRRFRPIHASTLRHARVLKASLIFSSSSFTYSQITLFCRVIECFFLHIALSYFNPPLPSPPIPLPSYTHGHYPSVCERRPARPITARASLFISEMGWNKSIVLGKAVLYRQLWTHKLQYVSFHFSGSWDLRSLSSLPPRPRRALQGPLWES